MEVHSLGLNSHRVVAFPTGQNSLWNRLGNHTLRLRIVLPGLAGRCREQLRSSRRLRRWSHLPRRNQLYWCRHLACADFRRCNTAGRRRRQVLDDPERRKCLDFPTSPFEPILAGRDHTALPQDQNSPPLDPDLLPIVPRRPYSFYDRLCARPIHPPSSVIV